MEEKIRELIQKAALGELSPEEQFLLEEAVKQDPVLQAELDTAKKVSSLVKDSGEPEFQPFFTTRVMQRISEQAEGGMDLAAALSSVFRKVAIAATVIIIALTSYNITSQWDERDQLSTMELAFNLPSLTIDKALDNIVGVP